MKEETIEKRIEGVLERGAVSRASMHGVIGAGRDETRVVLDRMVAAGVLETWVEGGVAQWYRLTDSSRWV